MAFQNQTYSNSNNAYYITNQAPVIPTDPTALAAPVEFLNLNPGGGVTGATGSASYYSRLQQNDNFGFVLTENSTIQGPLMGIGMNPNGTNGPVGITGPQIYAGFSSSIPNILLHSSVTEVFGTLAVGSKLNNQDVNALKIDYSSTPFPNTVINQPGITNTLKLNLNTLDSNGKASITVTNPQNSTQLTYSTIISPDSIKVRTTTTGSYSELTTTGGWGQVKAVAGNGEISMITTGAGINAALQSNYGLTVAVNQYTANVQAINIDTTGNVEIPVKMFGPQVSTTVATTSTVTANIAKIGKVTVTNSNNSSIPDYISGFNNYQGQLVYNTLRNYARPDPAPDTALESLEIINVSGGPQTGGIQFYTSNNDNPTNPKWMGGFLQNNTGPGVSEFRLASTVQASMTQLTNVSTINSIPIRNFGVPTGSMFAWCPYIPVPPDGYVICSGGQYDYTNPLYAPLYNVIGMTYTYGTVAANHFRVPNMLGKAAYGSCSSNDNVPPGNERINVNVTGSSYVTSPTGTNILSLLCNSTDQPLYVGMKSEVSGMSMVIGNIIYNPSVANGFILVPDTGFAYSLGGPYGSCDFYFDNANQARNGPYIGNNAINFSNSPGSGVSYYNMKTEEVAIHTHPQAAGAGGGVNTIGSSNPVQGSTTGNNNGTWSYAPPGGINTAVNATMKYIPPNLSTWWIIKL